MSKSVFRIVERATGKAMSAYQRGNYDQYDFPSAEAARESNVHGVFKDTEKFAVLEFEVTEKCLGEVQEEPT